MVVEVDKTVVDEIRRAEVRADPAHAAQAGEIVKGLFDRKDVLDGTAVENKIELAVPGRGHGQIQIVHVFGPFKIADVEPLHPAGMVAEVLKQGALVGVFQVGLAPGPGEVAKARGKLHLALRHVRMRQLVFDQKRLELRLSKITILHAEGEDILAGPQRHVGQHPRQLIDGVQGNTHGK